MKHKELFLSIFFVLITNQILASDFLHEEKKNKEYYSSVHMNLFKDLLGKSEQEIQLKINSAFNQLFYGDDSTQRIYYPVNPDMAYIKDILNNDVRTEGISYGLMIAVQLDKKNEFNRLWKWAKKFMQHKNEPRKGYFAWHTKTNGEIIDSNSASDGEVWIVTALFFASARWGNGDGIYNYSSEAQLILDAMLNKENASNLQHKIRNMFDKKEKQIVFVPSVGANYFTDPSYHTPHYFEIWSCKADKENNFWKEVAFVSRNFLKKTVNPTTGLAPDYAKFDGTPLNPWGGGNDNFQYDAWRVAMNIAIDFSWFGRDDWAVEQSNRLLNFFYSEGIGKYGHLYTLDGKKLGNDYRIGLLSMNAVAAIAATTENRKYFVEELWNASIPDGSERYYDGMLYMLALLQVSGNFKIYSCDQK